MTCLRVRQTHAPVRGIRLEEFEAPLVVGSLRRDVAMRSQVEPIA